MLLGPFRQVQDERGRQGKDQRGELVQVQTAGLVMFVVPDVTSTCMERKRSREPVVGRLPLEKWRGICKYCASCGAVMFYESSEAWVLDRAEIAVSELEPKVEPRIGKSGLLCFSTLFRRL